MKRNIKFLIIPFFSFFLLIGCDTLEVSDLTKQIQREATTELKKQLNVEIQNQSENTNLSQFTGENYSVLPKNERLVVTLKKHTDGDTSQFMLNGHKIKVRYLLIDTPETVKVNTEPQPFGYDASNRTKELFENANKIEIMLDRGERTDHYHRLLAYVFVDDILVQDTLIQEGLGRVAYVKEPSTTYLNQLEKSEQLAKNNKTGIWTIEGYVTAKGFQP